MASNADYVNAVGSRTGPINEIPGLSPWLSSRETQRRRDLEDWMVSREVEPVAWPTDGDFDAVIPTWWNGVAKSFDNFATRQLGVPTITVMMGVMPV
ncbi:hypothetical protein BJX65DRAFT_304017 [Aspergillus insuetus]